MIVLRLSLKWVQDNSNLCCARSGSDKRSGARKRRLLVLRNGRERGLNHGESFVELLVGDDQRDENANHVVKGASGDRDEAVLVAILGDGLGLGVGGLAGLRVTHQFEGAHAAETAHL